MSDNGEGASSALPSVARQNDLEQAQGAEGRRRNCATLSEVCNNAETAQLRPRFLSPFTQFSSSSRSARISSGAGGGSATAAA